jgi:hypothetical protein
VLLLMKRLDRPLGAKQIAEILDLDQHSVASYLRTLARLNLVARSSYHRGYILLGGRQRILGADPNVKISRLLPAPLQELTPLACALQEAGVGEPKRSALARLPGLTPAYVKTWETYLKVAKGPRYTPGLLIHVLETGEPAPPAQPNGHAEICGCDECRRLKYRRCPYCGAYDCDCVP